MGHGPAVQRSTNELYAEFKAKSDTPDSVTNKVVKAFNKAAGDIDLKDDVNPPEFVADPALILPLAKTRKKKTDVGKMKSQVAPWGFSKDEFARLNLAAQSLINLTKIEINSVAGGKRELKITVDGETNPWPLPNYTEKSKFPKPVAQGKFDVETWLQDSELILFMYMAAMDTKIKFNESPD